ncbi:hypothetical protein AB6A40_011334 [Gnathostoma spinigerum]|uniref:Uncharacterized protein n=1 Tax=Gnathostoma spinigerum TaxID=75299 RepID=A0ABD6EYU3_9BILA
MPDYVASIPRRRGTQNKPKNNRWRQQKLPAYRPLLTPLFALPITFLLAIVFISIGVTYYLAAVQANEFVIDYTSCSTSTAAVAHRNHTNANICSYTFLLDSDFTVSRLASCKVAD